jgi:hypothetical protein
VMAFPVRKKNITQTEEQNLNFIRNNNKKKSYEN